MSLIKSKRDSKGLQIAYACPDDPNTLKRRGKVLSLSLKVPQGFPDANGVVRSSGTVISLDGRQINTLKRILREAGE